MTINEITNENIKDIPIVEWDKIDNKKYDAVVIVPMDDIHDSGYRCMCFVFCERSTVVARSFGGSDVLHIDGIGGYGDWISIGEVPKLIEPKGWSIDCLPNGFLRIFCRGKIKNGNGLSDYDIFGEAFKGRCK